SFGAHSRAHGYHDETLGAEFARLVDGHVVHHAAIHQQSAVDTDRPQGAGYRHAGAHRGGEIAAREHHLVATHDVGGDAAELNRQVVEVLDVPARFVQLAH